MLVGLGFQISIAKSTYTLYRLTGLAKTTGAGAYRIHRQKRNQTQL